MHVKGLELPAYEPRRAVGQGLAYAIANRGGCHLNGGFMVILEGLGLNVDSQTPKSKADYVAFFQSVLETISASGQCLFTTYAAFPAPVLTKPNSLLAKIVNTASIHAEGFLRIINRFPRVFALHLPFFQHPKMIRYAIGMSVDFGKYVTIGQRGYNLERCINCRFGITAANDILPKRLTEVPQDPKDPKTKVPLEVMKQAYYAARGWDTNGIPTEATLRRLKIK